MFMGKHPAGGRGEPGRVIAAVSFGDILCEGPGAAGNKLRVS